MGMATLLECQSCCTTGHVNVVIFAIYFHGSFSPHGIFKAPFTLLGFFCFFCGIRDSIKAPSQLAAEALWEFGFGFTGKQLLFEPVPVTGYRSPHPSSPRLLGYVRLR